MSDVIPDAELRRIAAARQVERFGCVVDPHLAAETPPRRSHVNRLAVQGDPGESAPIAAHRLGDALWIEIVTAPRSKKNHGRRVWAPKQKRTVHVPSRAYEKYRREVIDAVASVKAKLELPLPDQPYNIAAIYHLDRYGSPADKCGLDQGLYDALQDAGVVTDDWWFRTDDGTRIILVDDHVLKPRVTIKITPIPDAVARAETP